MKLDIKKYDYLWTSKKDEYVLVKADDELGYGIFNKKLKMMFYVNDEELEKALIAKMRESGNKIYEDIIGAYSDID